MTTALTIILVLGFLVFIHEFGHYLAARMNGVKALEFSIGFPPKLYSRTIKGTEYIISLIPIGGYVRLKGQNFDDEDAEDPENYASKSVLQRFSILVAGPLMNLLTAVAAMSLVFFIGRDIPAYLKQAPVIGWTTPGSPAEKIGVKKNDIILSINGQRVSSWEEVRPSLNRINGPLARLTLKRNSGLVTRRFDAGLIKKDMGWRAKIDPIIGRVAKSSPAERAGLSANDRILKINGKEIRDWSRMSSVIQSVKGKKTKFSVLRNKRKLEFHIAPEWRPDIKRWAIGIGGPVVPVSETLSDSVVLGVRQAYDITLKVMEFLGQLIKGKEDSKNLGGPIMIASMLGEAADDGAADLIFLAGFISLQFAIFNLLPIPALDGGHIFFLLAEKIKGKALSKNFRVWTQRIGFSFLILLIIYVSVQDGIRLFQQ